MSTATVRPGDRHSAAVADAVARLSDVVDPAMTEALGVVVSSLDPTWRLLAEPADALAAVEAAEALAGFAHWASLRAVAILHEAIHADVVSEAEHLPERARVLRPDEDAAAATVAELAAATGWSLPECWRRLRVAASDPDRHTPLLDRLRRGQVNPATVRQVLAATSVCVSEDVPAIVDRVLTPVRGGHRPSHQLVTRRLRREVARCDSRTVDTERADAVRRRRVWAEIEPDGTGTLSVTADSGAIVAAMDRLGAAATALRAAGDPRTIDQLRADAALALLIGGVGRGGGPEAVPGADGPVHPAGRVSVVVPLSTLMGLDEGIAELPGYGFVTASHARHIAFAPGSVWRRLVVDDVTSRVVEASTYRYRPDPATARLVAARDHLCRGPGCTRPADRSDLDHQIPWPHGDTSPDNLTALHRGHHNLKTRRLWVSELQDDGAITWRTRAGRRYTTCPHDYLAELAPPPPAVDDPPPF